MFYLWASLLSEGLVALPFFSPHFPESLPATNLALETSPMARALSWDKSQPANPTEGPLHVQTQPFPTIPSFWDLTQTMGLEKGSGVTFKRATRESCVRFQKSPRHHNTQDDAKKRVWFSGKCFPCTLFSKRKVRDSGLFPKIQMFLTSSKLIVNLQGTQQDHGRCVALYPTHILHHRLITALLEKDKIFQQWQVRGAGEGPAPLQEFDEPLIPAA